MLDLEEALRKCGHISPKDSWTHMEKRDWLLRLCVIQKPPHMMLSLQM